VVHRPRPTQSAVPACGSRQVLRFSGLSAYHIVLVAVWGQTLGKRATGLPLRLSSGRARRSGRRSFDAATTGCSILGSPLGPLGLVVGVIVYGQPWCGRTAVACMISLRTLGHEPPLSYLPRGAKKPGELARTGGPSRHLSVVAQDSLKPSALLSGGRMRTRPRSRCRLIWMVFVGILGGGVSGRRWPAGAVVALAVVSLPYSCPREVGDLRSRFSTQ